MTQWVLGVSNTFLPLGHVWQHPFFMENVRFSIPWWKPLFGKHERNENRYLYFTFAPSFSLRAPLTTEISMDIKIIVHREMDINRLCSHGWSISIVQMSLQRRTMTSSHPPIGLSYPSIFGEYPQIDVHRILDSTIPVDVVKRALFFFRFSP